MTLARCLVLIGGILLLAGLACALVSTHYQVKAMGELRKGQLAFGPDPGSPGEQEKKREVAYSDCLFYLGLGLTAVGVVLQTAGALVG